MAAIGIVAAAIATTMFQSSPAHVASYYAASSLEVQQAYAPLEADLEVDVLVVGGGYTGLYTALNLAEAGRSVALLEASRIGWAASGRNGGQVIVGYSCDMEPFEAALGLAGAKEIWRLTQEASDEIRARIVRHQIDCGYTTGHLWTAVLPRRVQGLQHWHEQALRKWGYERLQFVPKADLPAHIDSQRYQGGLLDSGGGHLHPLRYALGLARAAQQAGVRIFENTQALSYSSSGEGVAVQTARARVRADRLVLACGALVDRFEPRLGRRVLPVGTYMIATEPLSAERAQALLPSGCAVSDNQFVLDYFRLSPDRRLLFGGKCSYTGRTPRDLTEGMRQDMLQVFPQLADLRIDYTWGGHIDITMERTPDFGRVGNVYWAQGFCGHGIVPTCVAGRVLAEAIGGDESHLHLFSALSHRDFPGGARLAGVLQALGMAYYRLRDYL